MVATAGGVVLALAAARRGRLQSPSGSSSSCVTRYASVASIVTALSLPVLVVVLGYPWPMIALRVAARRGGHRPAPRRTSAGSSAAPSTASTLRGSGVAAPQPVGERRLARALGSPVASSPRSSPTVPNRSATHVVDVDRLEVDLLREQEVAVVELRERRRARRASAMAHGVLDEARLRGARARRRTARPAASAGRRSARSSSARRCRRGPPRRGPARCRRRASAAPALVVRRDRDELEDLLDVVRLEAGLEQPLGGAVAHEALRARAGVDARSPRRRRRGAFRARDAAAIPQSVTISCVASRVTGVSRRIGHCARIHTSARSASWRSTTRLAICSASTSTSSASLVDDELDRLLEELGEARHVDALLVGREVDGAVDHRGHHRLGVAAADAHRLLDAGDAGAREGERDLGASETPAAAAARSRPRARRRLGRPARSSAQQAREPAVLEQPAAGLAARAVVDRVLLEVDARDRRAALRARLAEPVVDDGRRRVSPLPRSRSSSARVEVVAHRVGEPLDLLVGELGRGLERREPRAQEDLVRVGAADAGERALVAEQRMELPALARRGSRRARPASSSSASGPRWREILVELLRRDEPDPGALLLPAPR